MHEGLFAYIFFLSVTILPTYSIDNLDFVGCACNAGTAIFNLRPGSTALSE